MKRTAITAVAGTIMLSGCFQADDLVSADVREARQEIRQQGYMHMSCAELRRQHTAAKPAASPLMVIVPTSMIGREVLSDIEAVMKKKGCKPN